MKTLNLTLSALSLLAIVSCSNGDKAHEAPAATTDSVATTTAPTPEAVTPEPQMDSAAMAKAWESYMTPGDMHKWMAASDGKWKGEMISWEGPDMPPMPASAVSTENKMILGGRYQESVYKGKMMGMDFEGKSLMAYDNAKKKFINTWVDNMGTGVMYMEGTYDEATKSINLTGKMMDPSTGKDTEIRQVLSGDDKTQVMEMYCMKNGKEFKNMEVRLTKK